MKKMVTLGITIIASFSLAACGNNSKESSSSSTSNSSKETSGELLRVGQWHKADSSQGKATLVSIKNINKSQELNGTKYQFDTAKLVKINATKQSQLDDDESNFGESLNKTYYEYQLDYSVKNSSKQIVQTGETELITPDGSQLSTNSGSVDFLAGERIQPGAKKTSFIQAHVKSTDKLNKFKVVINPIADKDGYTIGEDTPITLALDN